MRVYLWQTFEDGVKGPLAQEQEALIGPIQLLKKGGLKGVELIQKELLVYL